MPKACTKKKKIVLFWPSHWWKIHENACAYWLIKRPKLSKEENANVSALVNQYKHQKRILEKSHMRWICAKRTVWWRSFVFIYLPYLFVILCIMLFCVVQCSSGVNGLGYWLKSQHSIATIVEPLSKTSPGPLYHGWPSTVTPTSFQTGQYKAKCMVAQQHDDLWFVILLQSYLYIHINLLIWD